MRSKEDALDYRYFPEPDLPVLRLKKDFIEEQKKYIQESPFSRSKRYKEKYNFNKEFITPLISSKTMSDYFENLVKDEINPKLAGKYMVNILSRYLNDEQIELEDVKFSYEDFKTIIEKEQNQELLENQAKDVFKEMVAT